MPEAIEPIEKRESNKPEADHEDQGQLKSFLYASVNAIDDEESEARDSQPKDRLASEAVGKFFPEQEQEIFQKDIYSMGVLALFKRNQELLEISSLNSS